MEPRAPAAGVLGIGHVRERLLVDVDQVERVLGHVAVDGDDRDDGLALVARHGHAMARYASSPSRETRAGALVGSVRSTTSSPTSTASTPASASAAEASSAAMRACGYGQRPMAAEQRGHVVEVVDEARGAAQQALVLRARHAGADPGQLLAARARPIHAGPRRRASR